MANKVKSDKCSLDKMQTQRITNDVDRTKSLQRQMSDLNMRRNMGYYF
jgi:hypothetical protein